MNMPFSLTKYDADYYPEVNEIRLSDSTLKSYRSCNRKLELGKIFGIDNRKGNDSVAAEAGKTLHHGYQQFLAYQDVEQATFELLLKHRFDLEQQQYGYDVNFIYSTFKAMLSSNSLQGWKLDDIILEDGKKRPAIEMPFRINLLSPYFQWDGAPNIYYVGFIDAVMYNMFKTEHCTVDVKTHRRNDKGKKDATAKYRFDEQQIPYAIVLDRMMGLKVKTLTVIYLDCYVDLWEPKITKYEIHKKEEEIEDWGRGLLMDLKNIEFAYKNQWFRRDSSSCFIFNRQCRFFDFCEVRNGGTLMNMIMDQEVSGKQMEIEPWVTIDLELTG